MDFLKTIASALSPSSNPASGVTVGSVVTNSHLISIITSSITFAAGVMGWGDAIHNLATIMGAAGVFAIAIAHSNIIGVTDANSLEAFGSALKEEADQINGVTTSTSSPAGA